MSRVEEKLSRVKKSNHFASLQKFHVDLFGKNFSLFLELALRYIRESRYPELHGITFYYVKRHRSCYASRKFVCSLTIVNRVTVHLIDIQAVLERRAPAGISLTHQTPKRSVGVGVIRSKVRRRIFSDNTVGRFHLFQLG